MKDPRMNITYDFEVEGDDELDYDTKSRTIYETDEDKGYDDDIPLFAQGMQYACFYSERTKEVCVFAICDTRSQRRRQRRKKTLK